MPRTTTNGASARDDDVRTRILHAARELFRQKSYRSTTTREISLRAQVAEPTIFRHFGSKVDLFEASILEPFTSFVDRWTEQWRQQSGDITLDELAESLVASLYTLVQKDAAIFRELVAARADPTSELYDSAVAISARFRDGFSSVHDVGIEVAVTKDLVYIDPPAAIGAVASMVIGSVVLGDWAFPANSRVPGKTRMIREMARLIVDGIAHRG